MYSMVTTVNAAAWYTRRVLRQQALGILGTPPKMVSMWG